MHTVAFSLKRAHLRTTAISLRCVRRFGITPARYDVLYAIAKGEVHLQRDLWQIFDVSRTTISRMLIALETLGLVRRYRSPGVASRFVELTTIGKRVIAEAIEGCQRPMCLLFESFFRRGVRRRLARAWQVIMIDDHIQWIAREFGDRSQFLYPCSHPEDIGD